MADHILPLPSCTDPAIAALASWFLRSLRALPDEGTGQAFDEAIRKGRMPFAGELLLSLIREPILRCLENQLTSIDAERLDQIAEYYSNGPAQGTSIAGASFVAILCGYASRLGSTQERALRSRIPRLVLTTLRLLVPRSGTVTTRAGMSLSKDLDRGSLALMVASQAQHLFPEWTSWILLRAKRRAPRALARARAYFLDVPPGDPKALYERTKETGRAALRPQRHTISPLAGPTLLETDSASYFGECLPGLLEHPAYIDMARIPTIQDRFLTAWETLSRGSVEDPQKLAEDFNDTCMARRLRVLQWELHTRDLGKEHLEGKIFLYPSIELGDVQVGRTSDSFVRELVKTSWLALHELMPSEGDYPARRRKLVPGISSKEHLEQVFVKLEFGRTLLTAFLRNLREIVPQTYPDAHQDFLLSLSSAYDANRTGGIRDALVLEDGELTFFLLLWAIRNAAAGQGAGEVRRWFMPPSSPQRAVVSAEGRQEIASHQLRCLFVPRQLLGGASVKRWDFDLWFEAGGPLDLLESLGLILRIEDNRCLKTQRWRSFVSWLRFHSAPRPEWEDGGSGPSLRRLGERHWPVKAVVAGGGGGGVALARELAEILCSARMREVVAFAEDGIYPDTCNQQRFVETELYPLVEALEPLWRRLDSTQVGMHDRALFKVCRAAFLPIESLVRGYHPYPSQLLILGFHRDESEAAPGLLPASVAFVTIVGEGATEAGSNDEGLPPQRPDVARGRNAGVSASESVDRTRWLLPYWTLFAGISSALSVLPRTKDSLMQGMYEMVGAVAHEVAQVAQLLRLGTKPRDGNLAWRYEWLWRKDVAPVAVDIEGGVLHRALVRHGVVMPFDKVYKAATNYLDIISDSKTAEKEGNPFVAWPGMDLAVVIKEATEFALWAAWGLWARRHLDVSSGSTGNDIDRLMVEAENAVRRAPVNVRLPVQCGLRLPPGDKESLSTAQVEDPDKLIWRWVSKMILAGVLNALKHATKEEDVFHLWPVAIWAVSQPEQPRIEIVIANGSGKCQPEEFVLRYGTGAALNVNVQHLRSKNLRAQARMGRLSHIPVPGDCLSFLACPEENIMKTVLSFEKQLAVLFLAKEG